jgi:hypothetical protein
MLYADAVRGYKATPKPKGNPIIGCATEAETDALTESDDPDEVLLHYMKPEANWYRHGPLDWNMHTKLPLIVNTGRTCELPDPEIYSRMAPREGWHEPNPSLSNTTPQPDQILGWRDRQLLFVWRLAGNEERRLDVMRTRGRLDEVPYNLFGARWYELSQYWDQMLYQCYQHYRENCEEYRHFGCV